MDKIKIINPLSITIRTREKVLFSGQAKALTSINEDGLFDVLPQHSNFISIIKDYVTVLKEDNTTLKFDLSSAIMQVTGDIVNIFVGILTPQVAQEHKISALEYLKSHPTKQK